MQTVPRLAEAIGRWTRVYTDDYGSLVEGDTYAGTDGSVHVSKTTLRDTPEQVAAAEAILGKQPKSYAPEAAAWSYTRSTAHSVAGGGTDVATACWLIMGSSYVREIPGIKPLPLPKPSAIETIPYDPEPTQISDDPMDHQAGTDRITKHLPSPPTSWLDGMGVKRHSKACIAAMLDAVPRLANGQKVTVSTEYASAPDLLWQITAVAEEAPKGSVAKARAWLGSSDNFDYPRSTVQSHCLAYDGVAAG